MDQLLKESLDFYTNLAKQPGWKEQAWHSVRVLAKEHPAFFWQLPELLVKEMQRES